MTDFGLLLPTREAVMRDAPPDFGQILEMAESADEYGFNSVWVGDSVIARPRFEALTTLAAIAARTERIKLGTAVLVPAMRQPLVLANEIANLDQISQGRLILGLGIGGVSPSNARELAACGFPIQHRVGLFEEGLTLMCRLWAGEEVTHKGRYFEMDAIRLGFLPVQKPRPPIWLAASVENAYRRVVRFADGWFPISGSAEAFSEGWDRIVALAPESGKDTRSLHRALYTTLTIDDDPTRAEAAMREFMESYYSVPYERMSRGTCAGTPDGCVSWLTEFIQAGVETIVVRFGSADQQGQLDRWRSLVLPRL